MISGGEANQGLKFRQAAFKGSIEELQRYYLPHLVNEPGKPSGKTALHLAAAAGKRGAVKWLIENGAKVEVRDADNNTPLLLALTHHQTKVADFFIAQSSESASTSAKPFFRLPPLVFVGSQAAANQAKALVENLPYLQSLGYKGFLIDGFGGISLDELIAFTRDMQHVRVPDWQHHDSMNKVFNAVKSSQIITFHPLESSMGMLSPMDRVRDEQRLAKKIVELADEHDGGVIAFLCLGENVLLINQLKTLLKEKSEQVIVYSESAPEALVQNMLLDAFYRNTCNFHDLTGRETSEELEREIKEPILRHFQSHTRDRYHGQSISTSLTLARLQSIDPGFQEYRNKLEPQFDAVLPVNDVSDYNDKAKFFSEIGITPSLCFSYMAEPKGKLTLTIKDVENPTCKRKILGATQKI